MYSSMFVVHLFCIPEAENLFVELQVEKNELLLLSYK